MESINDLRNQIRAFDGVTTEIVDGPEKHFANFKMMPLELLVEAEWNYKKEDEHKARALVQNIRRNGQVENCLVRELNDGRFEVINGNHRLRALRELGYRFIFVYDFGSIDIATAKRIAIETNETRFATDHIKLAELVQQVAETFSFEELAQTMPWPEQQLRDMTKVLEFDWNQQFGGSNESPGDSPRDHEESRKELKLSLPEETYNVWMKWRDRCQDLLGYDTPEQAFELAVIEALNIPDISLR